MQDIEQRLLSRFKWGLSAELHQPDYETRISILKNILYRDGVEMPEEIIEYVARNIKSNVRELEGAIISLIAQSSFNKKEVTFRISKTCCREICKKCKTRNFNRLHSKSSFRLFPIGFRNVTIKNQKTSCCSSKTIGYVFCKEIYQSFFGKYWFTNWR